MQKMLSLLIYIYHVGTNLKFVGAVAKLKNGVKTSHAFLIYSIVC